MRRTSSTVVLSGLCLLAMLSGCRTGETPPVDLRQPRSRVEPLAPPSYDGLSDAVRSQIEEQFETLRALETAEPESLAYAYGVLGRMLLVYEFHDAAATAMGNATVLAPGDHRWPYYLGIMERNAGSSESAVRRFERVLELRSDDLPTRIHLARLRGELGDSELAAAILNDVVTRDPDHAMAHFLLGQLAVDRATEAVAHFEKVLELQPDASSVRYSLGLAYRSLGRSEMAREQLELQGTGEIRFDDPLMRQAQRLRKGSTVALREGTNLLIAGRIEEAQAALTRAVTDGPQDATALLNLAIAERELGNLDRARDLLERAVEFDPTHSNAQLNLAMTYEKQGRVEEAIEHFHLAVETNPHNSTAHLALGRLYWLRRECANSAAHFEQFLKTSPDHVQARVSQGMCLVRLGEFDEARRVLETGYDAFPTDPGIGNALVRVLAASPDADVRDGQRALEIAAALVEALPRSETFESLAMAYAEVGRFDEAVRRQREMIRAVEERGQHPLLSHFRSNLERYEQGQACRTPWPPQLFER